MPALLDAFSQGTHAARPAAVPANAGYYYLETDTNGGTLFQSTGSAWVLLAPGAASVDARRSILSTAVDLTLTQANALVLVTAGSGLVNITLPAAAGNTGLLVTVKCTAAATIQMKLPGGVGADNGAQAPWTGISDGVTWWSIDF